MAPVHSQKLLLFILQRSSRPCVFSIFNGIVIASMDGFASVIAFLEDISRRKEQNQYNEKLFFQIVSLAMSYFTVLHSVRS